MTKRSPSPPKSEKARTTRPAAAKTIGAPERPAGLSLRWLAAALVLTALTVAVYLQVIDHGFVSFDDPDYLTENAVVQRGLTRDGLVWAFASPQVYNWHPLTWLSHMLDVQLFGLNPAGHHLMGLALHTVNALLLFGLLQALTGAFWRSAAAAALFALHPLHVESVAWASERKDLLSTLFWLTAIGLYLRYVRRPSPGRYGALCLAFAASLLAKQMAVTLPFLLLLIDYWPLGRLNAQAAAAPPQGGQGKGGPPGPGPAAVQPDWRRLWPLVREKIPLFALAAAASVTIYLVQSQTGITKSLAQYPFAARLGNALVSYVAYIAKTLWPLDLAVFYPHPGTGLPLWQAAGAGALLLAATVLVLRSRRPYLAVGWFWFLGTLVPVIGLVQVGLQGMADRYTYVPLVGLFLMLCWGVPELAARWRIGKTPLAAGAAVVLALLMPLTWRQVATWQNDLTLYGQAVKIGRTNYWAEHNFGRALLMAGRDAEALPHLEAAIRLQPAYPEAHLHLGILLARRGDLPAAAERFARVLALDPGHDKGLRNQSLLLIRMGRFDEAAGHLRTLRQARPEDAEAWFLTGLLEARRGEAAAAERAYGTALRLRPDYPEAHTNLGILLARQGRPGEAVPHFRETLRLRPEDPNARRNLEAALQEAARGR